MKYAKQQAARANQQAEYKEILQQEKDAIYAMVGFVVTGCCSVLVITSISFYFWI